MEQVYGDSVATDLKRSIKNLFFKCLPLLYGRKEKENNLELDEGIKADHLSALKLNQVTKQTEQFSRRNDDPQIRKARVIYWLELLSLLSQTFQNSMSMGASGQFSQLCSLCWRDILDNKYH